MIRAVVLAACLLCSPAVASDGLHVIDGDGIELNGQPVRLWGIDAPELSQTCLRDGQRYACGEAAKAALEALTAGQGVECYQESRDHHGRSVALCMAGDTDLGASLVRQGWALDWPRYSGGLYAAQQNQAKTARRGLWSGEFVPPWDWRQQKR